MKTGDRPRDATAVDLICAADVDVGGTSARASESAYRRGVHHGLALAGRLVDQSLSLRQAQRYLTRAENQAGEYRSLARHPGNPPILDEITRKVLRIRKARV